MSAAEEPSGSEEESSKKVNLTQLQTRSIHSSAIAPDLQHQDRLQQLNQQVNSNSNDASNASSSNFQNQQHDTERRYRPQKFCAVCGDKAIACNFNAVTCESCKAFFRRNAFKEQRLKCLFDNRCIIDRVTRRFCSKCRLLKCFDIGMKREWILTDEQKQIKRVKIMQNKQSKQQQQQQHRQSVSNSPSLTANRDESLLSLHQQQQHQQFIAATKRTSGNGHEQAAETSCSADGNNEVNHVANQQSAYVTNKDRRLPQLRAKVETRDATTSCDDPFELSFNGSSLGGSGGQLLHCSLASQCRFCSIKLTGSFSRNLEPHVAPQSHPQAQPTPTSAALSVSVANQFNGGNQSFDTSNSANQYQHQHQAALQQHGRLATVYGPTSHQQQQQQQQQHQSHLQIQQNSTCSSCPPTPKHLMRSNAASGNLQQQHHMAQATSSVPPFLLSQSTTSCCSLGQKTSSLENQNLNGDLSVKAENYLVWGDQIQLESNECRNN